MTKIKICGLCHLEDALLAAKLGADAVGFVFAESRRRISPEAAREIIAALPPFITTVGVFMNQPLDHVQEVARITGVDRIQLHGDEDPDFCRALQRPVIKRIPFRPGLSCEAIRETMRRYPGVFFLIDPGAGEGRPFDWRAVGEIRVPLILAGGLNPENVGEAIECLHPYAVDVSTGVEAAPGKKDPVKLKRFIEEVRWRSGQTPGAGSGPTAVDMFQKP